jgi:hypothetical protein
MDDETTPSDPSGTENRGRRADRLLLLRFWREPQSRGGPLATWRCSLEEPRSGQRRGFASVFDLAGYLLRAYGDPTRDRVEADGD